MISYELRVIWACARKDIRIALTDRVFTIAGLILPANILILMSLFVLAGSNAPTAVVMLDQGPLAQAFYAAMSGAHSFRLQQATATEAQRLLDGGNIVAVVTIPQDFDARVQRSEPVQVEVQVNNLNTDFTNDVRRAVPLAITSFYAKAFPNLVSVTPSELDLYPQDTDYIPYLGVSILVIALMVGALLQSSVSFAREWENDTIKELLFTPASRWAILSGKMLGALLVSLGSTVVVLAVLIFAVGVRPLYWHELIGFTLLLQVIFIATGALLGTLIKQRQPALALVFGASIPLFFLSGAFGPISFTTDAIQFIARLFPVYYGIVVMQHAFHGFDLNTYGLAGNTLILAGFALGISVLASLILRRSTVAH